MWFALAAFAAFRITRLITTDDITDVIRKAWWKKWPRDTKMGTLVACPYCVGVYVSAFVTFVLVIGFEQFRHWYSLWIIWPAIAGAQSLLNALDERLND